MEKIVHRIHPPSGFSPGIKELWHYRKFFYIFSMAGYQGEIQANVPGYTLGIASIAGVNADLHFTFYQNLEFYT